MKKKELNKDFNLVQFEEGDDVEFYAKTIHLILTKDPDGNYYCWDAYLQRVVRLDKDKGVWEKYEGSDYLDFEDINHDDALVFFKEHPPFDALEALEKEEAEKTLSALAKKCLNTPHTVVGWKSCFRGVYEYTQDEDESHLAALINDIVEHNYLFAGDSMELVPIFEDRTYLDFSARGWGHILALANNEAGEMDYVDYTFSPYLGSERNEPKDGFYEAINFYSVLSKEDYEEIFSDVINFEYKPDLIDEYCQAIAIVDKYECKLKYDEKKFYNFYFRNAETKQKFLALKARVCTFNTVEEFHELVDSYTEEERWKNYVIVNVKRIEEALEKGPVTVFIIFSV